MPTLSAAPRSNSWHWTSAAVEYSSIGKYGDWKVCAENVGNSHSNPRSPRVHLVCLALVTWNFAMTVNRIVASSNRFSCGAKSLLLEQRSELQLLAIALTSAKRTRPGEADAVGQMFGYQRGLADLVMY